jgi:hypothetical protein
MDLFRRLQEVADLPGSALAAPTAGESGQSSDPDELREQLSATLLELAAVSSKYDALRAECSSLHEEYVAYKLKVQTWREQMKAARAQDRRTIELLRESGAGAGGESAGTHHHQENTSGLLATPDGRSSSGGGGGGVVVEGAYVHSLEEQVKCLKESLREYGNQRDQLTLEVEKLKESARNKLLSATSSPDPAAGLGGPQASSRGDSLETAKLSALLERSSEELAKAKHQVAELELANDQLQREAQKSNDLLLDALTKLREDAKAHGALAAGDAQQQYIRSLEEELEKWRSAATAADDLRAWRSDVAALTTGARPEQATERSVDASSPGHQLREVQQKLDQALEQVRQQAAVIDGLQEQLLGLESSTSIREESLDHLYSENRHLRIRLESAMADAEAAHIAAAEAETIRDRQHREMVQLQLAVEEHEALVAAAKNTNQALTKELHAAREAVRQAKAAEATLRASVTVPPLAASVLVTSDAPLAQPSEPMSMKLSHAQIANLQHHMKTAWDAVSSRQRAIWSNQKLRLYYVTGLLVCLVLLFSMYQSTVLTDEPECHEQLVRCMATLSAK